MSRRREAAVAAAYFVLLLVLGVAAPSFFAADNLRDLVVGQAPTLVLVCGMTAVILSRQIDISIGSQFAICGVVVGLLAREGWPMPAAAAGAIAAGATLGAVNGALVGYAGLPAIVVTLATMVAWREALRWATEGVWVQDLPSTFQWFGLGQSRGRFAVVAVAALVCAASAWVLARTAAGRSIYATGCDAEAARLVGVEPRAVVLATFVAMGALTGLAAVLASVQFIDVQANAGVGLELRVIAAVVVGGVAITGGRGTIAGAVIGVALLATLGPALAFLGANAHWDRALQGAIILVAVSAEAITRQWSRPTHAAA
jgi:rhamnose transport system permease protein